MSHLLKAVREDIQAKRKAITALEQSLKPHQAELAELEELEERLLKRQQGAAPARRAAGARPTKAKPRRAAEGKQRPRPTRMRGNTAEQIAKVRDLLKGDPDLTGAKVKAALGVSDPTAYRYLALAKKPA